MSDKDELGGRDVTKFWLYMGIIALCIAALLYMLVTAKPRIEPAVKDNRGSGASLVYPLPLTAWDKAAC